MAFTPNQITKVHVLAAIEKIEADQVILNQPTRWYVLINDKKYPPKEVMRFAHEQYNGEKVWEYGGGEATNKYLIQMGFAMEDIRKDPVTLIIEKYKKHIRKGGLTEELYKWQLLAQYKGRPNLEAVNFLKELKDINFSNLIYQLSMAVSRHMAEDVTGDYIACFKVLFDESKPLIDRISYFDSQTLKIYRTIVPEERLSHHQDERTIATFLTYRNPDIYTFYKNSFYKKYCDLINVPSKKKGEKYVHYLQLIADLKNNYIKKDQELIDLFQSQLPTDVYQDTNYNILAQDILFQALEKQFGDKKRYWRIGTKDEDTSHWGSMKDGNKVCIGWPKIGDLNEVEIKSKQNIIQLLKDEPSYQSNNNVRSRKAGEIFNFYKHINIGDIVLAQDGIGVEGIGIVSDEYVYNDSEDFAHQKQVDWKLINPDFTNDVGLRTTVYELKDIRLKKEIDDLLNMEKVTASTHINIKNRTTLNQILFGPPGTGKTFHTVNKAVGIITPDFDLKQKREIVKDAFNILVRQGRILFTTFHQSMNYEDFIEGIKPLKPEENETHVKYDVTPGIFMKACANAANLCYKEYLKINQKTEAYTFDDLYDAYINHVSSLLATNTPPVYQTLRGSEVEVKKINRNDSIIARAKDSVANRSAPLTKENIQKLYDTFKTIDEIENLGQVKEAVQITPRITEFYAVFGGLKAFEVNEFQPNVDLIRESKEIDVIDEKENLSKFTAGVYNKAIKDFGKYAEPVVVIIDEINRGNVSQIFGELITLIEEDKRLGNKESLEVTLPYSKESFGVPPNLYIIGTMNTADRSVEALDTALRRRFSFEEMPPDYSLSELDYEVYGYKASDLLRTINSRIEKLLDKDHLIGHSYFIIDDDKNEADEVLKAFYKNIIPLLQEYFFGDFGKIGLVLGNGFVTIKDLGKKGNSFADFEHESSSDFDERVVYTIVDYRNPKDTTEMTFDKAIKLLMKNA